MRHYVYRLDDPITKEFYIGSRSCECEISDDYYMGSYVTWKPKDKTRLVKTIISEGFESRIIANECEYVIINKHINNPLNRNYHNTKNWCIQGTTRSTEWKLQQSINQTGVNNSMYGKVHTEENRRKMRENAGRPWQGKSRSEETKAKIRDTKLGTKLTDDHKMNISKGCTGKKHMPMSEEHKEKLRQARYNTINKTKL